MPGDITVQPFSVYPAVSHVYKGRNANLVPACMRVHPSVPRFFVERHHIGVTAFLRMKFDFD